MSVEVIAIDVACSTCYELGFETPEEITESDYFFRTVKPEEMK